MRAVIAPPVGVVAGAAPPPGREERAHAERLRRAIEIVTGEPYALPTEAENPWSGPVSAAPPTPEMLEQVMEQQLGPEIEKARGKGAADLLAMG